MQSTTHTVALYDVDHAAPTLTNTLTADDAGVLATAYGTVTHITTHDQWSLTLSSAGTQPLTVTWHTAPDTLPAIGEQILVVGTVRPQTDGTITLTALRDPVLTGRHHPTQPTDRPHPQAAQAELAVPEEQNPPTTVPETSPEPDRDPEWTGKDDNPLCNAIVDLLHAEHDREPWGVTYHRIHRYAVVVNTHPGEEDIRETFLRPWRRTLRKAGYRVQTRFDLNGTPDRQIGPTLEARYLLITPADGPQDVNDRPDDFGPTAFTDERAADMRIWPLSQYRAMRDLRI